MEASLTFWIVSAIAIVGGVSAFGFWVIFSQRPEPLPGELESAAHAANPWRRG